MDTPFDDQFLILRQLSVSQLLCDNLKTACFNLSWFYIFQLNLHRHSSQSLFQYFVNFLHIQMFSQFIGKDIILGFFEFLKIHAGNLIRIDSLLLTQRGYYGFCHCLFIKYAVHIRTVHIIFIGAVCLFRGNPA